MSDLTETMPIYTIQVGAAGIFTQEANVDISTTLNTEIAAAPKGDKISIIFNPGDYGVSSTILLPSNTTVIGNGATLGATSDFGGSALMANADSHYLNNNLIMTNENGTTTTLPYSAVNSDSMPADPTTVVFDSNISVQGMTFNETGNATNGNKFVGSVGMFGTWFTNAMNVDVQNNTYIGGTDGNAFVDVNNGVVADNQAVGVQNAAYDDWDGIENVTIEDNATFMSQAAGTGWSVLINGSSSGNPSNPGNAVNDGIIDNTFSGDIANSSATNVDPLLSLGQTTISSVTQQGNIDSVLGEPNPQGFYAVDVSNSTMDDNVVSDASETSNSANAVFYVLSSSGSGTNISKNDNISGNLVIGQTSPSQGSSLWASAYSTNINDNAAVNVGSTLNNEFPNSSATGDILVNGNSVTGTGLLQPLSISAQPNLFAFSDTATSLGSLTIDDGANDEISATLVTQFGSLSLGDSASLASFQSFDGEETIVISGTVQTINAELSELSYTSNSAGWDDSIEINVSNAEGESSTRYIPVLVNQDSVDINAITTIAPGFINTTWLDQTFFPGQTFTNQPTLNGSMVIASAGDTEISMGSSISVALLGSGQTSLEGGDNQEYISTGSGAANLNLDQGGDITIAGGSGEMVVNAENGQTLVQSGGSDASITGGDGEVTVVGGLGTTDFQGGTGSAYLTTLPSDGGQLIANLGTGNSTVLALSGDDTISSMNSTSNSITLGLGDDSVASYGDDTISTGSGDAIVHAFSGSSDTVNLGSGMVTFIDDTQSNLSGNAITQGYAALTSIGDPLIVNINGFSSISGSNAPIYIKANNEGKLISVSGSGTISDQSTSDTVVGGSGDLNFTGGFINSNDQITAGAGSTDVVLNGGYGTVQSGAGDTTVMASASEGVDISLGSGGGNVVGSSIGESVISTTSNAYDTISAGQSGSSASEKIQSFGTDDISVGGSATINAMSGSNDTITQSGGSMFCVVGSGGQYSDATATIDIHSGYATISALALSEANVNMFGSGIKLEFINQSMLPQHVLGAFMGSLTVSGGAGGGTYQGGLSGDNLLIGGAGADTFIGGGSGDILAVTSGSGQNMLISGVGDETLQASASTNSNLFVVNPGSVDQVSTAGSGVQAFFLEGAAGDKATITGSQAATAFNVFDFVDDNTLPGGMYSITNFSPSNSMIYISNASETGGGPATILDIQPDMAGPLGSTTIMLSNNTQISLVGVSASSLVISHLSNGITTIQ